MAIETCPTCGDPPKYRCKCLLGDMVCPAGHEWHHCPGCQKVIVGPSDHAKGARQHLCDECRRDRTALDRW